MLLTPQHRRSTRKRRAPKRYEDENFVSGRYDRYVHNYNGRNKENTFLAKLEDKDNTYFRPITKEDKDFIKSEVEEEDNQSHQPHFTMSCKQVIEDSDEEEWDSGDETEDDEEWIASLEEEYKDEDEDDENDDENDDEEFIVSEEDTDDEGSCPPTCACAYCDTKDPTNWGYNKKGQYVYMSSDDDFEQDENGNNCLKEDDEEEFEHYGHLSAQAREFMMEQERLQQQDSSDSTDEEIKNLCTECGVDMGPSNPRQLCGKTYCTNE